MTIADRQGTSEDENLKVKTDEAQNQLFKLFGYIIADKNEEEKKIQLRERIRIPAVHAWQCERV